MPDTPQHPRIDLQEVTTRSRAARQLIALAVPTLAEVWEHLDASLADTPDLAAESARLRVELGDARLDRANLAAAARATIAAHHEGEPDPLSYLRDELRAQGHNADPRRGGGGR